MPNRSKLRVVADNSMKKPPKKPTELAAEWISPKLLRPWKDNPRINEHVIPHVLDSILKYGWGRPIVARRANSEIIAGHTAWKAAMRGEMPFVPVRFLDISEEHAHELALADNKLGELADWDMGTLNALLKKIDAPDVAKLGWSDDDLKKLQSVATETDEGEVVEDDLPPPSKVVVTQQGDLWKLGDHRLLCGDSTISRDVARACGDAHPFICVTAPPLQEDGATDIASKAMHHFKGDVAYVWCQNVASIHDLLEKQSLECRAQIIWRKPTHVLSRGHYHWQHEFCWYAVRRGMQARWAGGRKQTTVWDMAGLSAFGGSQEAEDESSGAEAQKPVESFYRPLRNHGKEGDVVYEPFAGSGTGLIAAQQLQRVCIAIEIKPALCDLVVDRWQRMTGGKAKRVT